MRRATFVRISFTRRSQMCRAVTSLPSLPASGLSFDGEFHLDGRRIDRDVGQRGARFGITNGFADEHVFEAGEADDVAGVGFLDFDTLHAFEMEDGRDFVLGDFAMAVTADGGITEFHFAFVNFSERNTSEVIAVIEICHEHLETIAGFRAWRRNVFRDGIEQRFHGAGDVFEFDLGVTELGRAIDERKIQLLIGRIQRHEQFKDFVENFFGIRVVAIDFIDDDDGLGAGFERFAQHETGLRLRAVRGVDDEEHAVDHVHDTFDFAAEVSMSGGCRRC